MSLKPGSVLPKDMDPRTWAAWCRQDSTFPSDTAANIADKEAAINSDNKYAGKTVYDTNNHRLMISRGSTNTAVWDVVDGSASVTPS